MSAVLASVGYPLREVRAARPNPTAPYERDFRHEVDGFVFFGSVSVVPAEAPTHSDPGTGLEVEAAEVFLRGAEGAGSLLHILNPTIVHAIEQEQYAAVKRGAA